MGKDGGEGALASWPSSAGSPEDACSVVLNFVQVTALDDVPATQLAGIVPSIMMSDAGPGLHPLSPASARGRSESLWKCFRAVT